MDNKLRFIFSSSLNDFQSSIYHIDLAYNIFLECVKLLTCISRQSLSNNVGRQRLCFYDVVRSSSALQRYAFIRMQNARTSIFAMICFSSHFEFVLVFVLTIILEFPDTCRQIHKYLSTKSKIDK